MQSNIFELIDLLVQMSSSKSNIDELKADLEDTLNEISLTEVKLKELEADMNDEKYFDASSEIVDRNIKISLVKKIQGLNKIKSDIEKELDQAKQEEIDVHSQLEDIKKQINEANEYNSVISSIDSKKESFTNMIAVENERISNLLVRKEELESVYEKVQKKVEYLSNSLIEATEKIEKETDRLNEIDHSLSNIKTYIDFDAKEADEKEYLAVKGKLELLIDHKDKILNDPVYISYLIKEHIANDEKDAVEKEFNHLVDIVRAIPFMSLENSEIEDEMRKLNEELKNYDSQISQKDYQTLDAAFIEDRILYLEDSIKNVRESINGLNSLKDRFEYEIDVLSDKIHRSELQIQSIEDSLKEYEDYDYESEKLPKAVVQASNNKLLEEKANISEIAESYRSDLLKNIDVIKAINSRLEFYKNELSNKELELDKLNKKLALNTSSRNILEEEKDKLLLEEINTKINSLKFREEFTKPLSKILEEFEMLNSSLEFVGKDIRVQRPSQGVEEPKSISEEVVEENHGFMVPDEEINIPVISDEKEPEIITPTEKLRVVEIIPIGDSVTEKEEEKNFMVNDFQDDDYVDFESAISKVEEN